MDDWFNDPFFNTSGNPERDVQDHFARMEKQMNNMMNSMFSAFDDFGRMGNMRLGFDNNIPSNPSLEDQTHNRNTRSRNRFDEVPPETQEASAGRSHGRTRKAPIIEEPDDDDDNGNSYHDQSSRRSHDNFGGPQTYFYSSSMSSYMGPDGIQHSKKKTYDSSTGKTEMAEMRKLGNQAVAKKKEIDRDGHVTEMTDTRNLNEDDVDDFQRRFKSTYEHPSFGLDYNNTGSHHHHHHNALK